jgi:CBS domain-containing protein
MGGKPGTSGPSPIWKKDTQNRMTYASRVHDYEIIHNHAVSSGISRQVDGLETYSHIPVEDEQGKLVGLVSWLEIVRQQERLHDQHATEPVAVSSVMQQTPVSVAPEISVLDAISVMRKERLDCLLVVKEDHLVGIVTEHDILNITARLLEQQLGLFS